MHASNVPRARAALVGIRLPGTTEAECEDSLAELRRLVQTLGHETVGTLTQSRPSLNGPTVVGIGKLHELARLTGGKGEVASRVKRKVTKFQLRVDKAAEAAAEAAEADELDEAALAGAALDADADDTANDAEADGDADAEGEGDAGGDAAGDLEEGDDRKTFAADIGEFDGEEDASTAGDDEGADDEDAEDGSDELPPVPENERAGLVVFDCELTPSQMQRLESALGCEVLDRNAVIIQIFSRHARTRAAKLQVELARLAYLSPRMRETGGGGDRQGGGIGGKGAGESKLELDRRKIRDRMKELRDQLDVVAEEDERRRERRGQERTVALVGYTNAGKSSMMRALTGSEVLVEDKLFATLDTTVRPLHPEAQPRVLISDTVGFIQKLPHDLVASFRSTLEEALHATLLIFVVDASDRAFRQQLAVTREVLGEVGAGEIPSLLVLNKSDRIDAETRAALLEEFPDSICLSVLAPADVARLRERILMFFEEGMVDRKVFVPYQAQSSIGSIRAAMRVLGEEYTGEGVTLTVRALPETLDRVAKKLPTGVALSAD